MERLAATRDLIMSEAWVPPLQLSDTATGCRLTLVGVSYGNGETLQDAADDLVARLLNVVIGMRTSGFHFASELGAPDRRVLDFLWELGELANRGSDIRERVFGRPGMPDAVS
jgi:hypothetical protein